jgi:hypothetical protein
MRVLIHSTGQDTGGQGSRIKELLERHVEGIEVRSAIVKETYIGYPTDVLIRDSRHAQELFDWADVLHLRHRLIAWKQCSGDRARPTILHHHGTFFIENHRWFYPEVDGLGIRQFVSGLEMQEMEPGCTWLPQPHDMDALSAIRRKVYRRHSTLRIVQCPTRPSKGTAIVREAVARLAERYDFDFEVISGVSWAECLRQKARADIFIDQIGPGAWGYGNNAVEAWAMGMPVISEAPDPKVHARMLNAWGELPFLSTHGSTVEVQLERLITSKALREEYAARGEAHGRAFHDYPVGARQLDETYRSQPSTVGARLMPPSPTNRLIQVVDNTGRVRLMTPVRAKLRGYAPVTA